MKNLYSLLITLFVFTLSNAQIGFEDYNIIDDVNVTLYPEESIASDIDGDGDLDIVSVSRFDDKLVWFRNEDGLGNFSSPILISDFVRSASTVHVNDIDGDGDIDIITGSSFDDRVAWFENTDGQGTFGAQQIIGNNVNNIASLFTGDFDNDGDIDVVTTATYTNFELAWFENLDGMGNFGSEQVISALGSSWTAKSVYANDFDGDGDLDILASFSTAIFWFENLDGLGTFGPEILISNEVEDARSIYSADVDSDGDMDVLSASGGNNDRIAWYENLDGQGTFGPQLIISNTVLGGATVYMDDIDGDNDLDVLTASYDDEIIAWYENIDGTGNFGPINIISDYGFASGAHWIRSGDFDGDGDVDVLANFHGDDIVGLFMNLDGTGSFSDRIALNMGVISPSRVHCDDLDGDGDLDIIIATTGDKKLSWVENSNAQGNFGKQTIIDSHPFNFTSIYSGDIDGDGDKDVIGCYDFALNWFENVDGQGTFLDNNSVTTSGSNYRSCYAIDIDGDNDLDLLLAQSISVGWLENLDGLGTFGPYDQLFNAFGAYCVRAGDIDGDGDIDILSASITDDTFAWYENGDGQGDFITKHIITNTSDGARELEVADIDGDGDLDIFTFSSGELRIAWYENLDGQGSFSTEQLIDDSLTSSATLYPFDIDFDGDIDLISGSGSDNPLGWYENLNGSGNFSNLLIIDNISSAIWDVYVNDLDSDGDADIVTANGLDNRVIWYENLGVLGNVISGSVNIDLETNGCGVGVDSPMANLMIYTQNGTHDFATFTDNNGNYLLNVNEGTFTTSITSTLPNYYSSIPAFHTSNFVGLDNIDVADFCIEPNQSINDVNIVIYPLGDARPGFDVTYQIVYRNVGTTVLNGDVSITYDDAKMSFLEASETITSQTSNSLTFDYYDLLPFETRTIDVLFNVFTPPTTEIGDVLIFTAVVSPVPGDYTEDDNTFTLDQTVIGAYDPNDIQVLEGDEIYVEEIDEYLHYIIRFQNVGTASAINVLVTNELDPNLDWDTLQIENISHFNRVEITDGNQVEFIFNNINLPDSTTNEAESHGYIQYKIKPKSTVDVGDSMSNNANIYFDFNPPVVTNTVTTTVIEDLSINDNNMNEIKIYPNPTKGLLNVLTNGSNIEEIAIINLQGMVLKNVHFKNEIDVSSLSIGIYFIQLSVEGKTITKKFIKN